MPLTFSYIAHLFCDFQGRRFPHIPVFLQPVSLAEFSVKLSNQPHHLLSLRAPISL